MFRLGERNRRDTGIGAAMAAEIGTMRVTDQIDALTTLSTDPMKYLVAPRLLAATIPLGAKVLAQSAVVPHLPISRGVQRVLHEEITPAEGLRELLARERKPEYPS